MAWKKDHKQQTRQKILQSAAKLFTRDGFDQVGINDVMRDAGLTRGAFYAHFESKAELYAESIVAAAMAVGLDTQPGHANQQQLNQMIERYLSPEHLKGDGFRCPLAFLTTDITQRDDQVRSAYTRVFSGFINIVSRHLDSAKGEKDRAAAFQHAVMMIGGITIARALNDDALAEELIEACHRALVEPG